MTEDLEGRVAGGRYAGRWAAPLVALALAAGCASGSGGSSGTQPDDRRAREPAVEEPGTIYALGVPLRAVPSAGKCRIWRPGVRPGHQSGAGACGTMSSRVPEGAWLLRRREAAPDRIELIVYGDDGPSLIRVFGAEDGQLLRERMPR